MKSVFAVLLLSLVATAAQAAPAWHSWADVIPFPSSIDYDSVRTVRYEVYDINAVNPSKCPSHCFRVRVIVNGELIAVIPTSPGSLRHDWGGRTPQTGNSTTGLARWRTGGYKGYRLHNRGYLSGKRRDNLRYFTVFLFNGRDIGIGFHGDKGGVYRVTGKPESHGCMRLTDNNAFVVNALARAVVDNTGSGKGVRLQTKHTKRFSF